MVRSIRRWAPLIGVALLASAVILRALGLEDMARLLEGIGGVTGLSEQSPVGLGELAAAVAAVVGVALKIAAVLRQARTPVEDRVTPPALRG